MLRRRLTLAALVAGVALGAAACSSGGPSENGSGATTSTTEDPSTGIPPTTGPLGSPTSPIADGIRIEVLSSQPDRVSGSEARVRVTPAAGTSAADLEIAVNDVDATRSLRVVDGSLEGVLPGLIEGNNTVTATAGGEEALQRLRAWPITGPIISGPHLPLLACSTEANGLGRPTDGDCSAPTGVSWSYIDQRNRVVPLADPRRAPADLATATIDGKDVPLYVRRERGVINRAVYEVSSIDATPGDDDPTGPGWNRRLLYRYGGGCGTTYGQGGVTATSAAPDYLEQGYAVATASFNNFDVQCNDVLSAETTMMVKERVIEVLGVPEATIGIGAGGGAAQIHLLAQNYPGLINGGVATDPLPDVLSVWSGATDCGLLQHYYGTAAGQALTEAQRTAINGHATSATCASWAASDLGELDPSAGCDPAIPGDQIYDPLTNRDGVRCTLQDANRNQLGTDEATGWANRPLDNVGVQYGLNALNDGAITFEAFIDLNRSIGGFDPDGAITADREEADPEAVLHAYETGRISMGGGDQSLIPIIDIDRYDDPAGSTYDRFRAFSLRERLTWGTTEDGAPGFQIWTAPVTTDASPDALAALDEWLTALRDDRSGAPMPDVLTRTRPEAAEDRCLLPGGEDACEDLPTSGDPRTAAGAPTSDEVLKCSLKAVDPADYAEAPTADQMADLLDTFPGGVCDWSSAAEGEVVPANPDRSYDDVETPAQSA